MNLLHMIRERLQFCKILIQMDRPGLVVEAAYKAGVSDRRGKVMFCAPILMQDSSVSRRNL